jgi:hypothetical protein
LTQLLTIAKLLLILDEAVIGEIGIHSAAFVLQGLDRCSEVDLTFKELLRGDLVQLRRRVSIGANGFVVELNLVVVGSDADTDFLLVCCRLAVDAVTPIGRVVLVFAFVLLFLVEVGNVAVVV